MNEDTPFVTRTIVLVTDGIENSKVSFLNEPHLERNHDKVKGKLEKAYGPFPNVSGFKFILVHHPKEEDENGIKGLEFWKSFLESKGAKVQLSANL
jgi:hypothetical protein